MNAPPWVGEMTAAERVRAVTRFASTSEHPIIAEFKAGDLLAAIEDAEARARAKALEEAARVAENFDCSYPYTARDACSGMAYCLRTLNS